MINYIVNDPLCPIFVPVTLPPIDTSGPTFTMVGYIGNATEENFTLEYQAACGYYTMTQSLKLANKFLEKKLSKWQKDKNIIVLPRAGKQLNAFYDRKTIKFFWSFDPVTKKDIYTSNSSDIVSHEIGHAILDTIRPDFYNVQALEIWAFHEAFGDIHAIINNLQHEKVIDVLLEQTKGNLRQSNCITKVAEEMGNAIYHITGGKLGHSSASLRDLFNDFKYSDPKKLPKSGFDNQLTAEPHNFSRVFSGAWYDILVSMYENLKTTLKPKEALIAARDILSSYTYKALLIVPNTIKFYDAMAKAMLIIDKNNKYKFNKVMNDVFIKRQILKENIKPMVSLNFDSLKEYLKEKESDTVVYNKKEIKGILSREDKILSLPSHLINVTIGLDTMYEFNGMGMCTNIVTDSIDETIEHAKECVTYLEENNLIRNDQFAPFEINDSGELTRRHFACGCCNNNATNPQEPEYGKGYKPQNNAGCGCGGSKTPSCISTIPSVTIACSTPATIPCVSVNSTISNCGCSNTNNNVNTSTRSVISVLTRTDILNLF